MFYITISNGLLTKEHKARMGSAVWEFMWCLDKVTRVDAKGRGVVLGGKPVKLNEIGMGHDNTTSRNIQKLIDEKYIETTRTPYGMVIYVLKAKKRFTKISESKPTKNGESPTGNGESPTNNGGYKEDITVDSTDDITEPPETSSGKEIAELIKSFEVINPACKKFYGHPNQREACQNLIASYSFLRVKNVIEQTLPRTNGLPFFPTITTPQQLRDKWANLEAQIIKNNNKAKQDTEKVGKAFW